MADVPDGFYILPRRIVSDPRLRLSDVRLWMEIEQRQKFCKDCWWETSLHQLGREAQMSRSQTRRSLARLCEIAIDRTGLKYARLLTTGNYRRPIAVNVIKAKILLAMTNNLWD